MRLVSSGSTEPWLRHPALRGVGMSLLESLPGAGWWPRRSSGRVGHGPLGRGTSQLHLPATPGAAALARRHVGEACHAWTLDHLTDPAQLIITELVSNAVLHAGTPVDVTITRRRRFLHLAVRDADPTPPRLRQIDPAAAERGRGLRLIDAYAAGWGSLTGPRSKIVWATLRVVSPVGATEKRRRGSGSHRPAQPADR